MQQQKPEQKYIITNAESHRKTVVRLPFQRLSARSVYTQRWPYFNFHHGAKTLSYRIPIPVTKLLLHTLITNILYLGLEMIKE